MKLIKLILLVCLISTILSRRTNRRKKNEVSEEILKNILKNIEKDVPIQTEDWMSNKVLNLKNFGVGNEEENYDIFEINRKSKGNPLVFAFYYAVYEFGLEKLVDETKMKQFLFNIQHLYQDVPYHNKKHPADMIMRLVYWKRRILKLPVDKQNDDPKSLFIKMFDKSNEKNKELLELLVAIAGHDAFHPGLMNHQVCPNNEAKLPDHLNIYCELQKACQYKYPEILERVAAFLTANLFQKNFFFEFNGLDANNYSLDKIKDLVKQCSPIASTTDETQVSQKEKKKTIKKVKYNFNMKGVDNPIVNMIMNTEFVYGGLLKAKLLDTESIKGLEGEDGKIDDQEQRKLIMLLLDVGNPFAANTSQNLMLSSLVECEFLIGAKRADTTLNLNDLTFLKKWILFDQSVFVGFFGYNFFKKMNEDYSKINIMSNLEKSLFQYMHNVKKEDSSISHIVNECVKEFKPEALQIVEPKVDAIFKETSYETLAKPSIKIDQIEKDEIPTFEKIKEKAENLFTEFLKDKNTEKKNNSFWNFGEWDKDNKKRKYRRKLKK